MTTLAYTIAGLVVFGCAVFVYAACVYPARQMNNPSAWGAICMMERMMFEVGMKVVCVKDNWVNLRTHEKFTGNAPNVGTVYTIRDIGHDNDLDVTWLSVIGFRNQYSFRNFRLLRPNEATTRESWAEMLANPAKVRV